MNAKYSLASIAVLVVPLACHAAIGGGDVPSPQTTLTFTAYDLSEGARPQDADSWHLSRSGVKLMELNSVRVPLVKGLTSLNASKGGVYLYLEVDALGRPIGTNFAASESGLKPGRRIINGPISGAAPFNEDLLENVKGVIVFGGSPDDGVFVLPEPNTIAFFHNRGIKVYGNFILGPGWDSFTSCEIENSLKANENGEGALQGIRYPSAARLHQIMNNSSLDGWHFNIETECTDNNREIDWLRFIDDLHYLDVKGGIDREYLMFEGNGAAQAARSNTSFAGVTLAKKRYRVMRDSPSEAQVNAWVQQGIKPETMFASETLDTYITKYPFDMSVFHRTSSKVSGVKAYTSPQVLPANDGETIWRTYFNAGKGAAWYLAGQRASSVAYEDVLTFDLPRFRTEGAGQTASLGVGGYYGGTYARVQTQSMSVEPSLTVDLPNLTLTSGSSLYLDAGTNWPLKRVTAITADGATIVLYESTVLDRPTSGTVNQWRLAAGMPMNGAALFGTASTRKLVRMKIELFSGLAVNTTKFGFLRLYKSSNVRQARIYWEAELARDIALLHGPSPVTNPVKATYDLRQCDDELGFSHYSITSRADANYARADIFVDDYDGSKIYVGTLAKADASLTAPLQGLPYSYTRMYAQAFSQRGDADGASRSPVDQFATIQSISNGTRLSIMNTTSATSWRLFAPDGYAYDGIKWFVGKENVDQTSSSSAVEVRQTPYRSKTTLINTVKKGADGPRCYFNRNIEIVP